MAHANLNITVIEKRMLKKSEAATYTGLQLKHFENVCPVQPIELRRGTVVYDKRDLDLWIDRIKAGKEAVTQADIVRKL
ncbi:MAG: hypothetical protein QNI90_12880 [Dinoroseobacter sp.]|nr:hypothetical protein [Dinoroseobacter sp.]